MEAENDNPDSGDSVGLHIAKLHDVGPWRLTERK